MNYEDRLFPSHVIVPNKVFVSLQNHVFVLKEIFMPCIVFNFEARLLPNYAIIPKKVFISLLNHVLVLNEIFISCVVVVVMDNLVIMVWGQYCLFP